MLEEPKGIEYLITTADGLKIADDAPDWAVKSLTEYLEALNSSDEPDENGLYYE